MCTEKMSGRRKNWCRTVWPENSLINIQPTGDKMVIAYLGEDILLTSEIFFRYILRDTGMTNLKNLKEIMLSQVCHR